MSQIDQEKQRIVEGAEKIFAPLYDPAHDHVNVRIVAEELSRYLYGSLDTLHAAVVRQVEKEEASSLEGEDGKLFSRVVAKAFEVPFPAVAVQHAIRRVHERATRIAWKKVEDTIAEFGDKPEQALSILSEWAGETLHALSLSAPNKDKEE